MIALEKKAFTARLQVAEDQGHKKGWKSSALAQISFCKELKLWRGSE